VTGKSGSQENVPHANKSHLDEMIMMSPLYLTNMLSWILIELHVAHWNNYVDMLFHSDTLFWFRANQSLLFLL